MDRNADNPEGISITVRCRGKTGWLMTEANGDLVYEAANSTSANQRCCLDKSLPVKVFPLKEVLGGQASGSGVRIWYCTPETSGSGATFRRRHKLRKSDTFECNSPEEAQGLVSRVQQAASWWGRTSPPRVVAVVNPVSGQGKGRGVFADRVLPLLRDVAGLSVEVHTTASRGHATQIVKGLNLNQVDLILYVGGDGTVYEGMQGLMSRPDWASAVKVPFGTIPTGSGNGLAGSLGLWDPVGAAYAACKGQTNPIDLATVLQPPASRHYLLLSVTYGLMANLDIGTEHLRWMGEPRFTVGGIQEVMSGRMYPLRAALWPGEEPAPGDASVTLSHHDKQTHSKPSSPPRTLPPHTDSMTEALLGAESTNSHDQIPLHLAPSTTSSQNGAHGAVPSQTRQSATSPQGEGTSGPVLGGYPGGPPLPILSQFVSGLPSHVPAYPEDLPAGWRLLPEQVASRAQYFMLQNTTHLALNAPLNPKGLVCDGVWELMYTSGLTGWEGKTKGTQFLLNSETGKHVDFDFVKTEKVRAMILEPLAGDTTWMVLDGEQVPRDRPIYFEVHPGLCTAMVAPGWTPLL